MYKWVGKLFMIVPYIANYFFFKKKKGKLYKLRDDIKSLKCYEALTIKGLTISIWRKLRVRIHLPKMQKVIKRQKKKTFVYLVAHWLANQRLMLRWVLQPLRAEIQNYIIYYLNGNNIQKNALSWFFCYFKSLYLFHI